MEMANGDIWRGGPVRVVFISDTHGKHRQFGPLEGDVLVHCGDACGHANEARGDLDDLDDWFETLSFRRILCIGGNHDYPIERRATARESVLRNATYLQDEAYAYRGLRFYGAPWTPGLMGFAFYADGAAIQQKWDQIPNNIDVLITHTPPAGILDENSGGYSVGCRRLTAVLPRKQPQIHCFGHVHASAGLSHKGGTTFVNAASIRRNQAGLNLPISIDVWPR